MMDWSPIILSLKLAFLTTLILFLLSIPLAYWLSQTQSRLKPFIEALVSMPIVLPPTVIGFYLLLTFSPNHVFGEWLAQGAGIRMVFSFGGLVFASLIYSLPFMVNPIQSALASLPRSLSEASFVLGKSKLETLVKVLIPNIKSGLLTGVVLTFAHTVGEFGVVMMIGGSIPGETKVASIAIFEEVELLNYSNANTYSMVLIAITFSIIFSLYLYNRNTVAKLLP